MEFHKMDIAEINAMHRRMERNQLLNETVDQINAVRWATMTKEQQDVWTVYRQELLDISKQSRWPFEVIWPAKPFQQT
jgi:hypothetical protein